MKARSRCTSADFNHIDVIAREFDRTKPKPEAVRIDLETAKARLRRRLIADGRMKA